MRPAERRAMVARELGGRHDGVVRRQDLYDLGLTYDQVQAEIDAGRWHLVGRRSVSLVGPVLDAKAQRRVATWEVGAGAVLDGVTSLVEAGLTSWQENVIHVSVAKGTRVRPRPGVRIHHQRRMGRTLGTEPPRTAPEVATLRAAAWAVSDRQALTVLAMPVQQGLVSPQRLLEEWETTQRHRRRALLQEAVPLVCDGAQALSELDFARACRRHGLPAPSRQEVRHTAQGRIYLDVYFEDYGVHAELNGAHHYLKLAPVADARRRNDRALEGDISLEIPALGLLLDEAAFMEQVKRALWQRGWRPRSA